MSLSKEQSERYARNLALREVGIQGQEKLREAKVLIIGAGGLGSPAAMYLAAAGIGTLGIADGDRVDVSNLQRQILHTDEDTGRAKVLSARETLNRLNPEVTVHAYETTVTAANIMNLIADYDFILDASDNFETKFLINDACVLAGKPFSHAGVIRFTGQLMTWVPGQGPCYRCIFGGPPPADAVPDGRQAGVIGAAAGVIGSLQAMEAVRYILGCGKLLTGYLLNCDFLTMEFRKIRLPVRVPDCGVCGDHPVITLDNRKRYRGR